jgi:hypothetical protein
MWKAIWEASKGLLGSKKFQASILAGAAWGAGRLGWHVDAGEMTAAISPLLTFILAQGIADHGKSAAQVTAGSAPAATAAAAPANTAAAQTP